MPRARRARFVCALTGLVAGVGAASQLPQITERVDVSRVVVDVHAIEHDGRPIEGLTAADFRVSVDGRPVRVESVRWSTGAVWTPGEPAAPLPAISAAASAALPRGRLVALLFQKDLEPSRIEGLMNMLRRADGFLDGLSADDRIAVASFHHHLDLWTDFTGDLPAVREILKRSILFAGSPADASPGAAAGPTLPLDRAAGRRAATMEQALLVLARAFDRVPGSKSLVVFGHGFGRILAGSDLRSMSVGFDREYREAARLLARARVTVYCLDVTDAASHTLETGLRLVAADTGGFYLRTHEFPGLAMSRLSRAIGGHYELTFEKPDLPKGEHRIQVELPGRKGVVLARYSYVG